ncbi:hypothetical protein Hhel01_01115 [Haloferula helveola]
MSPDGVNPREAGAGAHLGAPGTAPAVARLKELAGSRAEAFYFALCQALTGRDIDVGAKDKQDQLRAVLVEQSYRIADALESQGIKAYGTAKLSMVGVISGESIELPDFRNIVFIPLVAQRKRSQMLKQLEYFVQAHPFSRMWVFTTGVRTPLHEVKERVEWLSRRISKLNARPFMRAAGVSIVFRSTELGCVARDETGTPTFHIHAHAIVDVERKLPLEEWCKFRDKVQTWWNFYFHEAGKLEGVRETCKYVVKPAELEILTAPELAELHRQLFGRKLVQCLGELKLQRKELEETRQCLVRIPGSGQSHLKALPKWNGGGCRKEVEEKPKHYDEPPKDWIVANLPPSTVLTTRAEPIVVVMNYTGSGQFHGNRRIEALREICGPKFVGGSDPPEGESPTLLHRRRVIDDPQSGGAGGQAE